MKVSGSSKNIQISSKVVAVNYPTVIKANSGQNSQIALPADNKKIKKV
jgi:hypothetical protein